MPDHLASGQLVRAATVTRRVAEGMGSGACLRLEDLAGEGADIGRERIALALLWRIPRRGVVSMQSRGPTSQESRRSQMPTFLVLAMLGMLVLFAAVSGDLPRMQSILLSPPYSNPKQIVTISRTGVISSAEWVVPYSWVDIWRHEQALEGVAA